MNSSNNLPHNSLLLLQLKPNTTYCGICGDSFSHIDITLRKRWSREHAANHTLHEHRIYQLSGLQFLPHAAAKLQHIAIPVIDLALNDEVQQALREAP